MKRFILALAFAAGAFSLPLSGQTPDSVKMGTPTREFYTKLAKPDTVIVKDTVFVASKPDTVWMPAVYPTGVDTVKYGADSLRLTFWSTGRITDSTKLVVLPPPPAPQPARWGPSGYFVEPTPGGPFTWAPNVSSGRSSTVLDNIAKAKSLKMPAQLALPCGSHSGDRDATGKLIKLGACLRDSSGVAVFSRQRFDSAARAILTPATAAAIVQAYKDGYVASIQIMDEPWVHGEDDGAGTTVGNTWGPDGTITRARADSLCGFVKALVPGVPVGLSDHHTWDIGHGFKVCDFGQPQFSYRYVQTKQFASIAAWRDFYLARAKQYGHQVSFSMNWINGGNQDRDGTWDCQGNPKGQASPNCQMTPTQVVEVVTVLGDDTCGGLMAWRSDDVRFSTAPYQDAIKKGLSIQAGRLLKPCVAR